MSSDWFAIGIAALAVAAVLAVTAIQMRRTSVPVAAKRLGSVGGGLEGIGIGLIVLSTLSDRLDSAPRWFGDMHSPPQDPGRGPRPTS